MSIEKFSKPEIDPRLELFSDLNHHQIALNTLDLARKAEIDPEKGIISTGHANFKFDGAEVRMRLEAKVHDLSKISVHGTTKTQDQEEPARFSYVVLKEKVLEHSTKKPVDEEEMERVKNLLAWANLHLTIPNYSQ